MNVVGRKSELKEKFPKCFTGIGKLRNYSLKIPIDPDVKPVVQPVRRVAYHWREKLEHKLDELVSQDIIDKVDEPNPQSIKIFKTCLKKHKVALNRLIYVGFSILDLLKTLMYDFHYNYMKTKYGPRAQLLFTDTDSLCLDVTTDDLYRVLKDKDLFDFNAYLRQHPLKDETESVPVKEFVGLKSKMYSLSHDDSEKRTATRVPKAVIRSKLRHGLYTSI